MPDRSVRRRGDVYTSPAIDAQIVRVGQTGPSLRDQTNGALGVQTSESRE